jgi:cytochrome oxidase Cu insertion factor (SCO1/SenC/PrrC family)
VDHSTRVYLVDQQRNLRLTYAYGTPPDDIAADIRYLLKQ